MIYQIHEFKDLVLDILKKYEVKQASLFGSIVRGKMTSESDFTGFCYKTDRNY
ncbi:MAG: nucleotidyltransferase domain-containing protein [Candidatus Hermodarchaeota archaeon]